MIKAPIHNCNDGGDTNRVHYLNCWNQLMTQQNYVSLVATYPGYGFSTLNISEVYDTKQVKMFQNTLPDLQYHVGLEVLTGKASQPEGRGRDKYFL